MSSAASARACLTILCISLALLNSACGDDTTANPSDLTGVPWKLASLQTDDFRVLSAPPDRYTVMFQNGERLAARSDCNSCGGTYQISRESLQIGPLACTRVFCGDNSLDLLYVRILEVARSYSIRDGSLTIDSARGLLRYTR